MKILVITDLYPIEENEKHTPRTIFDFVQGWKDLGHEVSVIKPNFILNSFLRKKPFYKSGQYGEVLNLNFWTPFWGNVKNKIPCGLIPTQALHDEGGSNDFDLVIAHMPSGLLYANKIADKNLPFVAGVHVSDIEVLTNPIYSVYFRTGLEKAYKRASKIACRSEILREKFLRLYPEFTKKTFVAYSGINPEFITQKEWQIKDRYRVLTCAKLIKRKNVDKVIKACDRIENIDLTVIGEGEELESLKKLSSKPAFLGHLEHSKVLEEMRNADIFILPSQNETFGMVYLEAMASGCVTVGLRGDGIDGIIENGVNGYLTGLNNIDLVIKKIINTDNNCLLQNAHETILNYTKEKACLNYLNNCF